MTREDAKQLLPIIQAFSEGKEIEGLYKGTKSPWFKIKDMDFSGGIIFRIKPEQKYRPFANAEECLAEMQKHQPVGWIKCQCAFFHAIYIEDRLIGYGSACGAILHIKFNDALKGFTFADGVPFGIKVE